MKLKPLLTVLIAGLLLGWAFIAFFPSASAQEALNAVFIGGYRYTHISSIANTQVKASSGVLHTLAVNSATAVGTVTVVDTSASNCSGGTTIAIIAATDAAQTFQYDLLFNNGLCITTAGASDLTVSSR